MTDAKTRLANRERQRKYREAHREEINEQRKARYKTRIKKGKCPRCGGKVKKGYTLCTECCDYQANLNRKYAKQRKKAAPKKSSVKKPAAKKATVKKAAAKKPAVRKTEKVKTAIKRRTAKKTKAKTKK